MRTQPDAQKFIIILLHAVAYKYIKDGKQYGTVLATVDNTLSTSVTQAT